jgi:LCP family protein required for cell wall assembly
LRARLGAFGELPEIVTPARRRATPPALTAALSFALPGLGHVAIGRVRRGLIFVAPAATIALALVAVLAGGRGALLSLAFAPQALVGLLVLNATLFLWHAAAILDSYRLAERSALTGVPFRPASMGIVVALLLATLALHGGIEALGYQTYTTLSAVFVEPQPGNEWAIPAPSIGPSPTPYVSDPAIAPPPTLPPTEATPPPTPDWAADGRLNLLLIGSDAGPGRWSLRTDTMIVLSVDVRTGHAALFGIPRNMVGVPLPPESAAAFPNGRFPDLMNALYVYAMDHPDRFPGGDARGFRAVSGAIQELLGVPLDGAVVINLTGFVRLVDAIGGLWIDVPTPLVDDAYPLETGSGHIAIDIEPGCHHLKGRIALAYARSRHQDDDYQRMRRQQAVLVALAQQVDPIALLPQVSDLLDIAKDNLWMTLRREDIRSLAALAADVHLGSVKTIQFSPPAYPEYLTTAEIERIRGVADSVFTDWSSAVSASPNPTPQACPAL